MSNQIDDYQCHENYQLKTNNLKEIKTRINAKIYCRILFILFFILLSQSDKLSSLIQEQLSKNNFYKIYPKLKLNDNYIPSLTEIFNSRELFISDAKVTREYVHFVKKLNETNANIGKMNPLQKPLVLEKDYLAPSKNKFNYTQFAKLCLEKKLIDNFNSSQYNNSPIISVILPSYNKGEFIIKSIRSIQNQSFKNIEIIIVDDCSTDNSTLYYQYLLKTDPRVRIFTHLKNMGTWRSRIDGFLYSRGKYVIHFDTGDFYHDNLVLEDAYEIIEKYHLDSVKMLFRYIYDYNNLTKGDIPFKIDESHSKIIYGRDNVELQDKIFFRGWNIIWSRLTKADIFTKGLYLMSTRVLNFYKNLWEDMWWSRFARIHSNNICLMKRYGYLYYLDGKGEGTVKRETPEQRDKLIHQFMYFLYFIYDILPKNDDKYRVVNVLERINNNIFFIKFDFFRTKFYILDDLLKMLMHDPFVSNKNKTFVHKLLGESRKRAKNIKNN